MHPSEIGAIIFDLGGVMLDWNPRYVYRGYFDTLEQIDAFLAEIDFPHWNLQQDLGRPFAEGVRELSTRFPEHAELIRLYHERWEDSVAGPIDAVVKVARTLKDSGYPLYALSNWSAETFPIAREKYECLRLFGHILISGDAGVAKPDRRIYNLMLQRIEQPASRCLLIDDSRKNVDAAEAMGFLTIHFRSPEQLISELQQMQLLTPGREE